MTHKIAAVLALLTAAIHIFVGGANALNPMLSAGLPAPVEGAMHACWHFVSVFFIYSAYIFWKGDRTVKHFAGLWLLFGAAFIYVSFRQSSFSGLIVNPQWTILFLTGAVALWASRKTVNS